MIGRGLVRGAKLVLDKCYRRWYDVGMKTLRITFPRKPQYTPATLTPAQLTRVERMVKLVFGRTHKDSVRTGGCSYHVRGSEYDRVFFYSTPALVNSTHPAGILRARMSAILRTDDGRDYFINCYRYLLAVGRNKGEVQDYQATSRKYAMASGYYG